MSILGVLLGLGIWAYLYNRRQSKILDAQFEKEIQTFDGFTNYINNRMNEPETKKIMEEVRDNVESRMTPEQLEFWTKGR